ncbi:c-type cytochrome biogenesis protein CcmI [uncultured Shimia sp.]|uniref:c-type cytochrome biogenesis protein CcmI n=1 Tax=uncultured Shimia sp. TaxID=573152 RepID=UPI002609754F|nr:c-type cytochrome biogenesis protein CcmI [uncultured Shimia sp.]
MIWAVLSLIALLAALWLALPFLRKRQMETLESDSILSVYRDQAEEVERDLESGMITEAEFDAAQAEIEARTLKAARRMDSGLSVSGQMPVMAGSIIAFTLAAGLAAYSQLGRPQIPDMALADRKEEVLIRRAEGGDIKSRITLLEEATEETPDDFDTWWMLARSYASIEEHAGAAEAYKHAARLSNDNPGVLSAYAEALTQANGNKVPPAARIVFEQVLRESEVPDPRARYYVALAKAQAQDFDGALHDWAMLAADSKPSDPWMGMVRRDIVNMVKFTEGDVLNYLPNASDEEIIASGGEVKPPDTGAMAARIVDLQIALDADPKNWEGWMEMAELQAVLGMTDAARATIETGKSHFEAAPFVLQQFDTALAILDGEERRGPDAEDIASAQEMTAEEQADMVDGMVAGLALRLEEDPDDVAGWVMLIRSYDVMGRADRAEAAYDTAANFFADRPEDLRAIRLETGYGAN